MRKYLLLCVLIAVAVTMMGCAGAIGLAGLSNDKSTTGKGINVNLLSDIQKGKTTSTQVVGLFGSPTEITEAGPNNLYVYKQCQYGGTSVGGAGLGVASKIIGGGAVSKSSAKQKCNELTVIINRKTDLVADFTYLKEFGK